MIVYWLMFLVPAVATLLPLRGTAPLSRATWLMVGSGLVFLIGLRHQVGGDWYTYLELYDLQVDARFVDVFLTKGPGANALDWFAASLGLQVYGANVISALIFTLGLVLFCKQQPFPWVALAVAVPYLVIVVAMGYTRQSVAIGFIFLALVELRHANQMRFIVLILLAAAFHQTAFLMLPLGVLGSQARSSIRVLAILALFLLILLTLLLSRYDALWQNYVEAEMASEGGAIRVWMSAVAGVVMLLFRKRWRLLWPDAKLWTYISLLALACIPLVGLASTAVDRMALYFIPLQLVVYSRIPVLLPGGLARAVCVVAILAAYAAVLFVWLNFATHSVYWVPYNNVTFLPSTT